MYAVTRIRGRTGIKRKIADNLDMLNLTRISHCVLIPETPSYKGMLQKGKDYIRKHFSPCAPFSIWSSSFFKENKLSFCEGIFHEDSEFTPRAYYLANRISFTNDIIYYVYQNPNSITRSINPKKSFDLVETVCDHLSVFCYNVDDDDKYVFHNMIAMYLNNALANIVKSDIEEQKKLNSCIYKHRDLFTHLFKSTKIKYKIEAFFFNMFPKHCLGVYKIMKHL